MSARSERSERRRQQGGARLRARRDKKASPRAISRKKRGDPSILDRELTPPVLEGIDASLLDIVDHVLTKGIVLTGDLVLGVADIDLVYLRVSAVLCAADRVLGKSPESAKRRQRHGQLPGTARGSLATKMGKPRLGKR